MKKFRIVQIGGSGHSGYAYPAIVKYKLDFAAYCPGAADENMSGVEQRFKKYGLHPKRTEDWKKTIEEYKPDIVIISSYMGYNAEMCLFAIEKGCSIFCEKPVATELSDLEKLEKAYDGAGVRLVGMFGILYTPHFEAARRIIESGVLGDIRLATAQKSYKLGKREPFYSSRELQGGIIPWVAIHAIDWIYSLCGFKFNSVSASHSTVGNRGNGELEVSSAMLFDCEGGRIAGINADFLRPAKAKTHDDDRLRVAGTDAVLEVIGNKVFLIDGKGRHKVKLTPPQYDIFEEMILELDGRGTCRVSAKETFDVTRIALKARESADEGKKVEI